VLMRDVCGAAAAKRGHELLLAESFES
jgi:hypothetical protein